MIFKMMVGTNTEKRRGCVEQNMKTIDKATKGNSSQRNETTATMATNIC